MAIVPLQLVCSIDRSCERQPVITHAVIKTESLTISDSKNVLFRDSVPGTYNIRFQNVVFRDSIWMSVPGTYNIRFQNVLFRQLGVAFDCLYLVHKISDSKNVLFRDSMPGT